VDRYRVKVKRQIPTSLWGGDGIGLNASHMINVPVLLNVRVDDIGEQITLRFKVAGTSGGPQDYGTLQPGETFTVPLQGLTSVFAECDFDTFVDCYIFCPASN
jgi:hypothetical protein